jgi:VCBS repeat-containing protein
MKKRKTILTLSTLALAGAGLAIALAPCEMVNAATFIDSTFADSFDEGIDATKYKTLNDTDAKFNFTTKNGTAEMTGYDYNSGSLVTADQVTVPEGKSLVVQFLHVQNSDGIGLIKGVTAGDFNGDDTAYATAFSEGWGDMLYWQATGSRIFTASNALGYQVANGATNSGATSWASIPHGGNNLMRMRFNSDGSANIYASTDDTEANMTEFFRYDASSFKKFGTGRVGFVGNGVTGTNIVDDFKAGYSDSDGTNITWSIEDDFETANSPKWYAKKSDKTKLLGTAKSMLANDPASGAGIIYDHKYTHVEGTSKIAKASLTLNFSTLGTKALGISAVNTADATSATAGYFAGLRLNGESKTELFIANNGTDVSGAVAIVDAAADNDLTIELEIKYLANTGKVQLVATFGSTSVTANAATGDGYIGIAALGDGSTIAKIISFSVSDYKGVVETGKSLFNDFSNSELDRNWQIVSHNNDGAAEDGHVYIKDGVLRFDQAGDNSIFAPTAKYANFEMSFYAKMQQYYEDDDGNVTKASTWIGISFGRESMDANFWDATAPMVYFQGDTIDTLNMGTQPRIWTTDHGFQLAANNDIMMKCTLRVYDGVCEVSCMKPGDTLDNAIKGTFTDVNSDGYIAITSTRGADFTIDDFSIVNLDFADATNTAPVAVDYTKSVNSSATLTDKVEATDAESDALTYELVTDKTGANGTLTFNADGNYSYLANKTYEDHSVTFTYRAYDGEKYSEVKTVTIAIKGETAPITSSSNPTTSSTPTTSSVSTTSASTPTTSNGGGSSTDGSTSNGCGGAIVGTAIVSALALAGVAVIAIKRKHSK